MKINVMKVMKAKEALLTAAYNNDKKAYDSIFNSLSKTYMKIVLNELEDIYANRTVVKNY